MKLKRILCIFLAVAILFTVTACKDTDKVESSGKTAVKHTKSNLLGFVVGRLEENSEMNVAFHNFLNTASDLGYNAKLYLADSENGITAQTDAAIADNCDAVLLYDSAADLKDCIHKLQKARIYALVLQDKYTEADCCIGMNNVITDAVNYIASNSTGDILIYSDVKVNTEDITISVSGNVKPSVISLTAQSSEQNSVITELTGYLDSHNNITAIYVDSSSLVKPAVKAAEGRNIFVVGTSISNSTAKMLGKGLNSVTVLPYHEMAAEAVYSMDKLINGKSCDDKYVTVDIVTEDNAEKYLQIKNTANEWFKAGD